MIRVAIALVLAVGAVPAFAQQSKEQTCALQNDVVGAIQQARLDRVRQRNVIPTLMEENPEWPRALEANLPLLVDWVYSLRRRDLRDNALGEAAEAQCLDQWDQIQSLVNTN